MDTSRINQKYTTIVNQMVLKALEKGMSKEEALQYILVGCQNKASNPDMDEMVASILLGLDSRMINRVLKAAGF